MARKEVFPNEPSFFMVIISRHDDSAVSKVMFSVAFRRRTYRIIRDFDSDADFAHLY